MTDENKKNETPQAEEKNEPTMDSKIDVLSNQFENFIDTITNIPTREARHEPEVNRVSEPSLSEDQIEELGFDKKQVDFINRHTTSIAEVVAEKVAKKVVGSYDQDKKHQFADETYRKEAYKEFPDLQNKHSKFSKLTDQIILDRKKYDRNAGERPDALYTAALEAERILKRQAETANQSNNPTAISTPRVTQRHGFMHGSSRTTSIKKEQESGNITESREFVRGKLRKSLQN